MARCVNLAILLPHMNPVFHDSIVKFFAEYGKSHKIDRLIKLLGRTLAEIFLYSITLYSASTVLMQFAVLPVLRRFHVSASVLHGFRSLPQRHHSEQ